MHLSVGVRRIEDLVAWQLAREFKLSAYRLVESSPRAYSDLRYRGQLFDALSSGEQNVSEGFHRFNRGDMLRFWTFARASVAEAKGRVQDGVDRSYFTAEDAAPTLTLGRRAGAAIAGLQASLRLKEE